MNLTVAELAQQLGGEVLGDANAALAGFASAEKARPGDATFAENAKFFRAAEASAATAIIAGKDFSSTTKTVIRVSHPRVAYAKAVALFFPEPKCVAGIHPSAAIARSAHIDPSAHIGPHCTIGERVQIGARCVLLSGNFIGDDSVLGDETKLFPNVVIYARTQIGQRVRIHASTVIGADGFGYVFDAGVHLKVPQIGNVIIGDDVEIGSNVSVDRAALGSTIIRRGTKIDNLVQVAHNVEIGENSILCAQVGISGSTKLGNFVVLAGQVGLAGHLKLGDKVTVMSQAGVMNDIPEGETWLGSPAQPDRQAKRVMIAAQRLPDTLKKIAAMEKKLAVE